jgi:endonuclease G, mitochondrial
MDRLGGMLVARLAHLLAALLLAVTATSPANASHRNCTATEKQRADQQLWLSPEDKQLSLDTHLRWGAPPIPAGASNEFYLSQRDYIILYDGDLRIPLLTAERVDAHSLGNIHRTDCFRRDVRIDAPLDSKPSDYKEPIFDQGHLAAFANQTTSIIAANNSFIMSNMVPQTCQFNRGIWQILEGVVRLWAADRQTLYVMSGSIFDRDADGQRDSDEAAARMTSQNGKRRVAVPTAFFKVIAAENQDGSVDTLTFVMPHNQENPDGDAAVSYLQAHVASLADVAQRTGLNLFPAPTVLREAQQLWPFDRDRIPNSLCHEGPRADFSALWAQ